MGASVLVVDDDDDIASLLVVGLSREQISAVRATNGEEALTAVRVELPRVILLDWMMPGKDGVEVTREIRQDQSLDQPRILMLTARASSEDRRIAVEAGVSGILTKPFRIREVVAQVKEHLLAHETGEGQASP